MTRPALLRPFGALALAVLVCGAASGKTDAESKTDAKEAAASLNQSVETGLRQAQTKRLGGDLSGAVQILSQLMLVNADDARVVAEYGKVLVQQGRSREALDFLKRGVQLSGKDWTLYSALGVAYDGAGDYDNAKLAYEHALLLNPGEPAVLNNYALSRAQAGDLTGAKAMISDAAAKSPDDRIGRNVAMINGLAPKTAAAATRSAAAKDGSKTASAPPRPLTSAEGKQVVMQAVPVDPQAGPVKKPRQTAANTPAPVKPVAPKPAKASKDGIPALRLANDRL